MANFKPTTALKIVLEKLQAKSVLLATVNNTFDVAQSGSLNDPIKVYIDPLTNVQNRTYTDSNVGTPRPKYTWDRLAKTSTNITLDQQLYAAFGANGWDTIDFADEQASNYSEFTTVLANQLAGQIDTGLATSMNGLTAIDVDIDAGEKEDVALDVLNAIQEQVDDLDQSGVDVSDLVIAIHPAVGRKLSPALEKYSFTGDSANTALRANIIGELYGAPVIKTAKLAVNTAVIYTKDAFVVAGRPSGKSSGAKISATVKSDTGVALTANLSFNTDTQEDVLVVSTFAKVGVLEADRARRVEFTFAA